MREKYRWLAGGWCWFGAREKYYWLVAAEHVCMHEKRPLKDEGMDVLYLCGTRHLKKDETLLLGLVIGLTCMLTVVRETIGGFVVGMVGRVFGGLLYVTSISCVLVSYIGTKFIYSCEKSSGVR